MNAALLEHQRLFARLHEIAPDIDAAFSVIKSAIMSGHKILLCGNGGSAADGQHFAAELVGKWKELRCALPAIALTTDTSTITAIANDFGYEQVFARQVKAHANRGDVLIAISTSGHSPNVREAIEACHEQEIASILLTGASDCKYTGSRVIRVPSTDTARIQEAHAFILHVWAAGIDEYYQPWPET